MSIKQTFIEFGKQIDAKILSISNSLESFWGYLYIISGWKPGKNEHSKWAQLALRFWEYSYIFGSFLGKEVIKKALQNEFVGSSEFIGSWFKTKNSLSFLLLLKFLVFVPIIDLLILSLLILSIIGVFIASSLTPKLFELVSLLFISVSFDKLLIISSLFFLFNY